MSMLLQIPATGFCPHRQGSIMPIRGRWRTSPSASGLGHTVAVKTTVLGALMLALAGCGDSGDRPATPAPTPSLEPIPLTITSPRDQTAAFAQGEWSYFSALVLDAASGQIHTIDRTVPNESGPYVGPIQWTGDDTLTTADGYSVSLSGETSTAFGPVPTTTPGVMPDVPGSADDLWSAERNLSISGITLTEAATGRRFDLPDTDAYQWAPSGHLMATGGGWCGGGRVSTIDPGSGSITPITPGGPEGHGVVYVWRPDGKALALDLLSPLSLVLVDAMTGAKTDLIAAPPEYVGEFVPLEWNPSGTHLLFRIHGGRDCSN
jgi:hypothetical protein